MKITFTEFSKFNATAKSAKGALVLPVAEGAFSTFVKSIDEACAGKLKKAVSNSRFEGKAKQSFTLPLPEGLSYSHLVLVGLGKLKDLNATKLEAIGGTITSIVNGLAAERATIALEPLKAGKLEAEKIALHVAIGLELKSYRFDKYRTKLKEEDKPTLKEAAIATEHSKSASDLFAVESKVLEGVFFTRDLVNEPGNTLHPESYAEIIKKQLTPFGVKVEILGEKEMQKMGCGALLGVGQGSIRESKMVVMQWNGAGKKDQPVAFVGKGVTFDTGGISIKPSGGMEEMKMDMGGSGTVVGLMQALASRKAKANVIGVVGLVENMPDGNAQRPGDVVTSLSGQTIEVLNTDAEGRLVLADCLWYCQDRFKPQFMIDLATLTGAIMVALGEIKAGLFSNDEALCNKLEKLSAETNEPLWHMPLDDEYDALLKSDVADMQNISSGRWGGSITAAQFLQRFVNDTPWAHLDIAGVATASKANDTCPKGATGYGVRLLNALVAEHYESK